MYMNSHSQQVNTTSTPNKVYIFDFSLKRKMKIKADS